MDPAPLKCPQPPSGPTSLFLMLPWRLCRKHPDGSWDLRDKQDTQVRVSQDSRSWVGSDPQHFCSWWWFGGKYVDQKTSPGGGGCIGDICATFHLRILRIATFSCGFGSQVANWEPQEAANIDESLPLHSFPETQHLLNPGLAAKSSNFPQLKPSKGYEGLARKPKMLASCLFAWNREWVSYDFRCAVVGWSIKITYLLYWGQCQSLQESTIDFLLFSGVLSV